MYWVHVVVQNYPQKLVWLDVLQLVLDNVMLPVVWYWFCHMKCLEEHGI